MTWYRSCWILACTILATSILYVAGASQNVHADTTGTVRIAQTLWGKTLISNSAVGREPDLNQLNQPNRRALGSNGIHAPLVVLNGSPKQLHSHYDDILRVLPSAHTLPRKVSYTVHSGDTLWQISMDTKMSVNELKVINHLDSDVIYPGQKLQVSPAKPILLSTKVIRTSTRPSRHQMDTAMTHSGIPSKLIPIYQAAGQKYGVPWPVLAAIHRDETNFATTQIFSSAGAEGPMQFMPATFQHFGVSAPGRHGAPDINNVYDAIYSCANMLEKDGYQNNPEEALYLYNHSSSYVKKIEELADEYAV